MSTKKQNRKRKEKGEFEDIENAGLKQKKTKLGEGSAVARAVEGDAPSKKQAKREKFAEQKAPRDKFAEAKAPRAKMAA